MRFNKSKDGTLRATFRPRVRIGRMEIIYGIYRDCYKRNVTSRKIAIQVAIEQYIGRGNLNIDDDIEDDSEEYLAAIALTDKLFPELRE